MLFFKNKNQKNQQKTQKPKRSSAKSIEIYGVYNSAPENIDFNKEPPVYYTGSYEEASEAVLVLLYQKYFQNFLLWLLYHPEKAALPSASQQADLEDAISKFLSDDIDFTDAAAAKDIAFLHNYASPYSAAFSYYLDLCIYNKTASGVLPKDDEDRYSIVTLSYKKEDIATFLRMLTLSHPLGLQNESAGEISNYLLLSNLRSGSSGHQKTPDDTSYIPGSFEPIFLYSKSFVNSISDALSIIREKLSQQNSHTNDNAKTGGDDVDAKN